MATIGGKEEIDQQRMLRISDIAQEPLETLLPIEGYENMPLVSLEEAVEKLVHLLPRIQTYAHVAKKRCKNPADDLTQDEAASIMLYTMGWEPANECLYVVLNATLRSKDRQKLKPWFLYLRLLLNAFFRLPLISDTVFRGVRSDLSKQYQIGDVIEWWGFSSCTRSMHVLQSELFLGKKGVRTMFTIQCLNGKDICKHSYYQSEDEILLLPATQFKVISCLDQDNLKMIHLREITPEFQLLQPIPISGDKKSQVKKNTVKIEGKRKSWLNLQFHDVDQQHIIKPDELHIDKEHYPPSEIDAHLLERIQGSMFGLAIGDALGVHVERKPRSYMMENPVKDLRGGGTWNLAAGQYTDDTSMALCLANSLIACQGFVPYDQLVRYKWWYRHGYMSSTGCCLDIGASTEQSIKEFERRQRIFALEYGISLEEMYVPPNQDLPNKFNVYCSADGVAGNGALIRLAPVPLFFHRDPVKAVEYSGISGQITHGDRKVYDACRYYGALIVAAVRGESKGQLLDDRFYHFHQAWFGDESLDADIMNIAHGSYKRKGGYDDGIRGKGYIVNALEAALWAFWVDEGSFEKGALNAINLGDDAGSTAAIYGQLAGTYYGYNQLPRKWCPKIYAKELLKCVSHWIAYEGEQ